MTQDELATAVMAKLLPLLSEQIQVGHDKIVTALEHLNEVTVIAMDEMRERVDTLERGF